MSKWVAKRDDGNHGHDEGRHRLDRNGKGLGKDAGAAARQAGEVRRLIRLAAQEARGDPRRKSQSEEVNGFKFQVGPPVGSSSAPEAWEAGYEGYWNDWGASWSEWGGWQSRDWKSSKGSSKGYHKGTPSWSYAEPKDAWQEWDWEEDLWDEGSEWDEYITVKDSTVRVELSGAELGDADLKELMQYLDEYMERYVDENGGHYNLNIDLSCNSYVTDNGVSSHLVPFLQKWPVCQRLKLYKNALGDPTLKALSNWVADGYAQELHLSDLSGKVSSDAVLHLLKEIHRKQNYPCSNGKGKCPLWLRLEHNGISDVDGLLEKAQSLGISVTLVDKADLGRVRPGGKGKDSKDPNTAIHLVMFRPQERRRGKGHAHHEEHEDSTDGYSRPTSPPDYFKGQEEDDAYKEKKGGKGKDAKFGKTAPTAKPLTASDLQMGAASYRTQMSKHPGAPNQLAQAKAKQGKIDIGSAAAFPSLGGPEKPEATPNWGPNLQAAVAWGSAPTAVFAAPKPQPKPISPVLGPTPKEVPVQEIKEKEKPGSASAGASKLPAPVGAAGAAPTEAPQRPPPIGADVRSLKGFSGPPQQAAREILGAIGAPFRPSSPVAPLTPPSAGPEEGGMPEVRSWQAPTAPPSSPPNEAAKPKPMAVPLPSLPPSVAPMVEPERPKLSPPTEPPQAAPAAPATPAAPAENVLRRLPNAPSKPAPPAPVPTPAPQVAALAPAPQVAPVVAPTAPPSMPPEVAARVAPAPTQPVMAPPSQAPRTAPQVPPKVAPQTPPHVPEQPGRRKVVEEDVAAIYEVPGDMVWKPLSYAEKNILKARKKIREVEKIEEAYAVKGKLEPGQLAKVQRKAELEQELRVYEQRSHSQGGRNLHELEQAEQCRKTHERYEHAATYVQKVMRKCLVKKRLPEFQEEAKVRRAERDHAAKQIQKVIRTYQSKLQAHKARREAMESTEAEEVKENLSPDLPEAVPESWEGSTFSEKVKHAPPAAAAPAAPAAPAPPAPVGAFGFRLPPPGTVTRRDVGQANSSWQEAEDQHPVNPAATFLQRIGHDWQEPQEPPPEPPNDAWNASDFLAPPVAVDEPQRSAAESPELPIEAAPEVTIEAEAPMEEPIQRAELEVPMPSVTSSVEVERTEEKKKEETQIAAEGSTLSKFLRRVVGASAADVAPAERRTEAQAEPEPPASAPAPPPAPPPAPAEVPHESPAVAVAPSAAPATPATPATPALPPQVAGFSKFFQRISGNATAEKEDKEETKVIEKEVVQSEISRSEGREREPPSEDEDGEKVQEVHKIDHKYVGLVIGKDGSTIKSFKKQSGASIEIDQTLPPGMPRMVIYRGTKKQVASARKLVDGIVLRAKEEEKAAGAPGTSGRDKDEKGPQDGRTDLPLWRRGKPGEDEKAFAERRKKEWHKPKEIEAAPSGSLTGLSSASMRPAWMRPKTEQEEKFVDKCIWSEQKYSRGLLLQAKQKILKMKAYEVPEEMMTMTTGPRPKHRKEKDGDEEDEEERRERKRKAKEAKEAAKAAAREENHQEQASVEASKEPEAKHEETGGQPAARTSYENLPGDSKEMLKLKKKLREIQKIEDSMAAGESVEPLQASKVHKKEAYLEELHFLESIVNEGEMEA